MSWITDRDFFFDHYIPSVEGPGGYFSCIWVKAGSKPKGLTMEGPYVSI